ncbi:MAG: hypothetical protein ABWY07_05230 [Burkholderiales bacterium]
MRVIAGLLLPVVAAMFVACGGLESAGSGSPAAEAPIFRVGDTWVYRATDGFRTPLRWEETHEVIAVAPGAITVRVTESGPNARGTRTEVWATPGLLQTGPVFDEETRRFTVPVKIYDFPMSPGQRWNQWVDNEWMDRAAGNALRSGQINRYVTVGEWKRVPTPAGTYDALALRVLMRLDDEEFWRWPTTCNYVVYYAPAVGAMVRAEKRAEYWEKGDRRDGIGAIQSQHATLELVSYARGPS